MKQFILFIFICCSLSTAVARDYSERDSGLLLLSGKKTKLIPCNRRVKIWVGEENTVYRAKILAVDNDYAYLSTGDKILIKDIRSIRRKRIMLQDVGNAAVAVGGGVGGVMFEAAFGTAEDDYDRNSYNYEDNSDLGETGKMLVVGTIATISTAVGTGIIVGTAGVAVGIFEPRYRIGEWEVKPLNPTDGLIFVK